MWGFWARKGITRANFIKGFETLKLLFPLEAHKSMGDCKEETIYRKNDHSFNLRGILWGIGHRMDKMHIENGLKGYS